ncbi:SGNH/GDSL hydrolase family protein [Epidermidibacterium keratini]|uniref:SGNH/GDSL hydrolase family protein n=1 Tax=Epidermidibacterium keratini TaxID=1891644 RepID=A0A7L4YM62_9ACTN|nr:SGNH/GDSL hydrolase family protein [Epidermidibacterium keratini]QHC00230.1 SGNH/GDSL hydrolase family protein [Epidermidibacterium keratini]
MRGAMTAYSRFVAIGDSTTEGLEDPYPPGHHPYAETGHTLSPSHPDPAGSYRGWADRLAEHIAGSQEQPLEYANLAVRGNVLADIHRDQLPRALELRPELMTIVGGVNDAASPKWKEASARGYLSSMFHQAQRAGITVVTFTMPDPASINWMVRPLRRHILQLNAITREEGARYGAHVLDLAMTDVSTDPRMWHPDRLHATPLGHETIAAGLAHALGLSGFESYADPLDAIDPSPWRDRRRADTEWLRTYFGPYVVRKIRGRSMGDGLSPKRPHPIPVDPNVNSVDPSVNSVDPNETPMGSSRAAS